MSVELKKEIELEIAHVLFLDIVGYSKLSVNEQHAQVEELNEIVRLCEQFRKAEAAGRLLKIPPATAWQSSCWQLIHWQNLLASEKHRAAWRAHLLRAKL